MKNNLFFLLIFVFSFQIMHSQTSYIITKKKEKIVIDDDRDKIKINWWDYELHYHKPGDKKERSIRLKDIESAMAGDYKIDRHFIEKDNQLFFTIAESGNFRLVGGPVPTNYVVYTSSTQVIPPDRYYIIDENYKIIETINDTDKKWTVDAEKKIKKYFSDYPGLMNRIKANNQTDIKYKGLSKFLKSRYEMQAEDSGYISTMLKKPFFTPCEIKYKLVDNTAAQSIPNQEYYFEKMNSIGYMLSQKGTVAIKDGYFTYNCDGTTFELKINNFEDNVLTCTSESGTIYIVKILPEINAVKGFKYDTKVIMTYGHMDADGTTTFFCQKK